MSSLEKQSWQTKHEQLIEKHQQLLERFYDTILNEDEDTDVSDEVSQLSSLIKSYQELIAVQISRD